MTTWARTSSTHHNTGGNSNSSNNNNTHSVTSSTTTGGGLPRPTSESTLHAAYLLAIASFNNGTETSSTNNTKRMRPDGTYIDNLLPGLPTPNDGLDRATSMGVILSHDNGGTPVVSSHHTGNITNTSPHLAPVSDGLQRQLSAFSMAMLPEVANSYSNQASIDIGNSLNNGNPYHQQHQHSDRSNSSVDRMLSASSTSAIGALTAMASMVMPEHMNSATSTTGTARTSPSGTRGGISVGQTVQQQRNNGSGGSRISPLTSPNAYRVGGGNSGYSDTVGFSYHNNNNSHQQSSPSTNTHHNHPGGSLPYPSTSPTSMYTQAGLMGPPSAGLDLGRATSLGLSSILMDNNSATNNNGSNTSTNTSPLTVLNSSTTNNSSSNYTNTNFSSSSTISPYRTSFSTLNNNSRSVLPTGNNYHTSYGTVNGNTTTNNNNNLNALPPMLQISTSFSSLADAAERESSVGYNPGQDRYIGNNNDDSLSVVNTPHVDATPVVV